MKIILGSSSRFRRAVMDELGIPYEIISPDIDEKAIRFSDPDELTMAIAQAKADAVVAQVREEAIIVCSDQVVVWNNQIREKPRDEAEAKQFIMSYSEHPAVFVNSLVVTHVPSGRRVSGTVAMHSWYMPISEVAADELIKHSELMHCAGAIQFEHPLFQHFMIHTDGTREHAMGLPKEQLLEYMSQFGYHPDIMSRA